MVSLHTYSLRPGMSPAAQKAHLDRCFQATPQTSVKSPHPSLPSVDVPRSLQSCFLPTSYSRVMLLEIHQISCGISDPHDPELRSWYPLMGGGHPLYTDIRSSLTTGACRAPGSSFLRDHWLQPDLCIFATGRENFMAADEEKRKMNTAVEKGRVKADNCCKTLHAQEFRAVKSLGWALAMTFQVSSSTAMQMSGAKSYHRLCGNASLRALLRGRASRQEHSFITSPYWPQLFHYLATLETSKPIPRRCLFTDTQELMRALRSCHPSKHGVAGRVPRSRGVAGCEIAMVLQDSWRWTIATWRPPNTIIFYSPDKPSFRSRININFSGWEEEGDIVSKLPCDHQAPCPPPQGKHAKGHPDLAIFAVQTGWEAK